MAKFWSNFSNVTNKLLQFFAGFVKIMSLLQTAKVALDPSYFLKYLKQIISKTGNPTFDLFSQYHAAKILSYILGELYGESIHASESIRNYIRQTILCPACQQFTSTENLSCILQLPVLDLIQSSLNSNLESTLLSGANDFFCQNCCCPNLLFILIFLPRRLSNLGCVFGCNNPTYDISYF